MNTDLFWVTPETNLVDTAELMHKHDVGAVPVCTDNKHLVGIVTDRDIVIRNVATGRKPEETWVKDIMSTSIKTGTPNMTIDEACDVMAEWQVRRLPIIENDSLVGIVSIGDIAVDCNYDMEVSDCLSEICEHDHDWDWK
jgi:CBS domain-containing protein